MMLTLFKTLSWAVLSGVLIGTTAYLECENLRTALVTALVASCLKTPLYSMHEMAWNRIKPKKHTCHKCKRVDEPVILKVAA